MTSKGSKETKIQFLKRKSLVFPKDSKYNVVHSLFSNSLQSSPRIKFQSQKIQKKDLCMFCTFLVTFWWLFYRKKFDDFGWLFCCHWLIGSKLWKLEVENNMVDFVITWVCIVRKSKLSTKNLLVLGISKRALCKIEKKSSKLFYFL